jgi:hypothetical protein
MGDVAAELPGATRLGASPQSVGFQLDVLITALGFEDRCGVVPAALAGAGIRADVGVVFTYETNAQENAGKRDVLFAALSDACRETVELSADSAVASQQLRRHLQLTASRVDGRPVRVGWDISVASNQLIMKTASVLLDGEYELDVLYAEAERYYPTRDEYEANRAVWLGEDHLGLDKGTLNVRVSSEHPGEHSSQLGKHLVLIPGYNRDRVRRVVSKVDPQFLTDLAGAPITWLVGKPHLDEDAWRRDALLEIHSVPDSHPRVELSTFRYIDTLLELDRIYQEFGLNYNITLCPMGSKLQALGSAVFCRARPDVQVMFAQPVEYNAAHYTAGVRDIWQVGIGNTARLASRLMDVGTLTRVGR